MLTQVAKSRVHCLVTAGDESISRILFSLSLSPYSFFSHTYFFFLSQSCKSIFTFIGEMYVVDTTWFPNSSMQENMGRESSPSHLLKVHGPVPFPPPLLCSHCPPSHARMLPLGLQIPEHHPQEAFLVSPTSALGLPL